MPYIVTDECILCEACIVGCPHDAIEEGESQCHITVALCIECGTCEQHCPSGAIMFVDLEEPEPSG